MCAWLRRNRDSLDHTGGVGTIEGPEILQIVADLEGDKACVEDLGAVQTVGRLGKKRVFPRSPGIPPLVAGELRRNQCARSVAGSIGEIVSPRLERDCGLNVRSTHGARTMAATRSAR